jgi:hypothetical protein
MFTVQELQRTTFGDDEDYEDTKEEISTVVDQVSETIEKNLDEDLLARLDRGEYPRVASALRCWPSLLSWRSIWPYWNYNMYYGGRSWIRPINRGNGGNKDMLDQILEDFRADLEARLKKARRENQPLSEAEIDDALQSLKQDLSVVARRTQRREERHEEQETSRGRRAGRAGKEA